MAYSRLHTPVWPSGASWSGLTMHIALHMCVRHVVCIGVFVCVCVRVVSLIFCDHKCLSVGVRDTIFYYRARTLMAVRHHDYKAHFFTRSGFGLDPPEVSVYG